MMSAIPTTVSTPTSPSRDVRALEHTAALYPDTPSSPEVGFSGEIREPHSRPPLVTGCHSRTIATAMNAQPTAKTAIGSSERLVQELDVDSVEMRWTGPHSDPVHQRRRPGTFGSSYQPGPGASPVWESVSAMAAL